MLFPLPQCPVPDSGTVCVPGHALSVTFNVAGYETLATGLNVTLIVQLVPVVSEHGTNLKQLTQGKKDEEPAISPDGRWVVFTALGSKDVLMKVSSNGGPASQLTDYNSAWPAIFPDGKWIASCRRGRNQNYTLSDPLHPEDLMNLAMVPFTGGQPAKVFPLPATAGDQFAWSPDGRAISFINTVNGVGNIWDQPIAGGPPQPATHFTSDRIFWFDWSRDGRLALSRGTDGTDAVLIRNFQ